MKIEFNDNGVIATATITSTVFEFSRHKRLVNTVVFLSPWIQASSTGFFIMKTVISGKAPHVYSAYRTMKQEAAR